VDSVQARSLGGYWGFSREHRNSQRWPHRSPEPRATVAGGRNLWEENPEANTTYHDIVRSHAAEAARVPGAPWLPTAHVPIGAGSSDDRAFSEKTSPSHAS
jgi:hypothetical protein